MQNLFLILAMSVLFLTPLSLDSFAQNSYDVNIPTGASDRHAPYFWQSEKDGATGMIDVVVDDVIIWKNADTTIHDVSSGTESLPLDLFYSGIMQPGKSFSYVFTEPGIYPYFCSLHPWMEGTVNVATGYSMLPNVGKQVGDGSVFFDVEYEFNRVLSSAIIDENEKSITFEIIGDAKSDNHDLELLLPTDLIDGPFVIWVEDEKLVDFDVVQENNLNILSVPLNADAMSVTIIGTSIVPEFGPIVMLILVASIVPILFLSKRFVSY